MAAGAPLFFRGSGGWEYCWWQAAITLPRSWSPGAP